MIFERLSSRELITKDEENPEDLAARLEILMEKMGVDTVNHEYRIRLVVDRIVPRGD